ncbi:hypothetical protein ApDm4_2344 [Acetobacter pomorum]|nr:hypothetical protein ApDm4_2344 [Acetobacter pomorum]
MLRRIAIIRIAQKAGLTLAEIKDAFPSRLSTKAHLSTR